MKEVRVAEALKSVQTGISLRVAGWVRTKRDSKAGFSFIELNDGSCVTNLQIIADKGLPNYENEIMRLQTGCSIVAEGLLCESPGKGQRVELKASAIKVMGWADPGKYPLQKKHHSFEFLRSIAYLRPRTNTFAAVARVRSALSYAIHSFFHDRGFVYLHTPIIVRNDCEGAGDMFRVTTLDINRAQERPFDFTDDFFCTQSFLTVSGQLEAEAYASAIGDVYTFGPAFRAENSNTSRHLAEFWMVEPEMAFCDLEKDMDVAEELIRYLFDFLLKECKEDMDFFNRFIDSTLIDTIKILSDKNFTRITYTEAVEILSGSGKNFEFSVSWGADLQSEHERYLSEQIFHGPIIIIDYPKDIKAFYMKLNPDGKTVRAMDVIVPRVGEIIGGSQREDRYDVLYDRMQETGIDPEKYQWYLDLRRFGSVPHSGFGLGFDRFVQFVTGLSNIRDVIPFPRTPKNLDF